MKKYLLLIIFLSGSLFSNESQSIKNNMAFKNINIEMGDAFQALNLQEKNSHLNIVNTAITFVSIFQPEENNFFNWTETRETFKNKTFSIYYTTSTEERLRNILSLDKKEYQETDAVTIFLGETMQTCQITICLFVDKLFFDEEGNERKDGFSRLVVALAHEIYGHMPTYLKVTEYLPSSLKVEEISAFTKSVAFIERLLEGLKDDNGIFADTHNREKLINDFENALEREKDYLNHWKNL